MPINSIVNTVRYCFADLTSVKTRTLLVKIRCQLFHKVV